MPEIHVIDHDGSKTTLDAPNDIAIMETLRDGGTSVMGTCGGICSCGTCHVYFNAADLAKLPEKTDDEDMMLEALGDLVELKEGSRLACQIPMTDELAGISIEIAPEA